MRSFSWSVRASSLRGIQQIHLYKVVMDEHCQDWVGALRLLILLYQQAHRYSVVIAACVWR